MSSFPCCTFQMSKSSKHEMRQLPSDSPLLPRRQSHLDMNEQPQNPVETAKREDSEDTATTTKAQTFTFQQLADATENFSLECLVGVGGYGKVYKGKLEETGQIVTVERLYTSASRGHKEFLVEVLMLSTLNHPNMINLVGYCAEGDERLLVHEYMPLGSLDHHMHDITTKNKPLNWYTRMKIALGIARVLDYLHHKVNPPVIYRNMKLSNILLDNDFHAKLSDFGLAKLGPIGEKVHVSTKVIGTLGYIAPEYEKTGFLTVKADVYSFGVVLLELITGQRAIDITRPTEEQNLVVWAHHILRTRKNLQNLLIHVFRGIFQLQVSIKRLQ